ncbi:MULTISPECIES: RNA 2',3'-cyclic phosphodiesterase [Aminobacterium]|jgi:2'-5' RNA ligase|uniref:RNA 2',3'-cyclic phosphodiesterase n=1 Tax=Aminobacterium colombiense (strain DSM 12261 / ALA-1) TaxID=572547 RepID=D5EDA4_AMICL|nr:MULTISPECIES: RNA 2',3'-cyclic phosphodiesterase [Aminobacterium]MDD2378726.1 RNA 2',3'-cyclic phosphodiesterase [Aminobacterium colombiense]ADE56536.1 2'-5' RNA ligase [Aminobacterium colombiense DSM 12261]MDD3767443.1 RNA 2',3'-cyclic phosphodiesterase [Aminobacterium colombiense]MDD4266522.1 RNA 2',3'-cyclic phosphodiesterase [Aminobacterium colombiense]MDD4585411.1 RNA 2',3'-cyclic phosphodiesterase [Aminobacterium colombiense]
MSLFIRTFVCVELPEQHRRTLAVTLKSLKKNFSEIKWVSPQTLHLTLKFCGEQSEDTIGCFSSYIKEELQLRRLDPFLITLGSAGAFPSLKRPRTLWIGVTEGGDPLLSLVELVEKAGLRAGVEKEKRIFHPHLTLARIRPGTFVSPQLEEELGRQNFNSLSWKVSSIVLMKSELRPEGAQHTPLETYSL